MSLAKSRCPVRKGRGGGESPERQRAVRCDEALHVCGAHEPRDAIAYLDQANHHRLVAIDVADVAIAADEST